MRPSDTLGGLSPSTLKGISRSLSRWRVFLAFTRPFTLLPPLLGVVSGAVTAHGSAYNPDPERRLTESVLATIVLGSFCAALLNAASNGINQLYDLEIDRKNKPDRPLVSGALSLVEGWWFSAILYVLAIVPTWLVVVYPYHRLGDKLSAPLERHECLFIFLAGMLLTFVYSVPTFGRTLPTGESWPNDMSL